MSKASVIMKVVDSRFKSPSASGDNTNVWVVKSRGPNRYVDELRYKDPENSPGNREAADYECMQDTDQEQPTIQCQTITFRFMNGNGKTSLPMNSLSRQR